MLYKMFLQSVAELALPDVEMHLDVKVILAQRTPLVGREQDGLSCPMMHKARSTRGPRQLSRLQKSEEVFLKQSSAPPDSNQPLYFTFSPHHRS